MEFLSSTSAILFYIMSSTTIGMQMLAQQEMRNQNFKNLTNHFGVTLPLVIATITALIYLIIVGIKIAWYVPFCMFGIICLVPFCIPKIILFFLAISPIITIPILAFCMFYFM